MITMAPSSANGLSPRTNRSAREATMASPEANDDVSNSKHRGIRPIEGLSYARIAGGRLLLRFRTMNPTKTLVPAFVFFVVVILIQKSKNFVQYSSSRARISNGGTPLQARPLMVQILTNSSHSISHLQLPQEYAPLIERDNVYWIDHGASFHKPKSELKEGCSPLADWQQSFHSNCNAFHEVPLSELVDEEGGWELGRLINNGAYRDVWGIREYDGTRRVMKTLRYINSRNFDQRNFDRHRRDAVASEQLSASPYIVNIYGYCANSALTDYCDDGDLFDVHEGEEKPTKNELLQIAYDVAASVADAHHYDGRGRATIAHTDIKPNQWIYLNGRYQLNDFNRCRLLTWDNRNDEVCGFEVQRNAGVWRAPEEYKYEMETEKLDVFSLGNVLYFLLTQRVPLDDMDSDDGPDFIAKGGRVKVTEKDILRSTHPFDTTLLKAMDMCFTYDPKQRASAAEVRDFIKTGLDRIQSDGRR